jgi:hypothetical protein
MVRFGGAPQGRGSRSPREVRLLDQPTAPVEGPPDADLPSPVELSGAHEAPIGAIPLPCTVHLAVEAEALQLDHSTCVVLDLWNWLGTLDHSGSIASARRPSQMAAEERGRAVEGKIGGGGAVSVA